MGTRILYIILLTILISTNACTEPHEIETRDYESVLVVESTITNEIKPQIVKLSKTSTLDTVAVLWEANAAVEVLGSNGESFTFSQDSNLGYYVSDQAFSAEANVFYTLKIKTQDGRSFTSTAVMLPPAVEMDEVFADRVSEPTQNKDGVEVLVNTQDPTGKAKYFRYEYEETYKIKVPYPSQYYAEIVNYIPNPESYQIVLTPRIPEEICYSTEYSTGIVQTSTTEFNENRVFRFPIKYLSKDDSKFRERYSILVKQYVQSVEAFTFYKILRELGSVGSLLSQSQPGYVVGNISADKDPNLKVVGFFEASSTSSRRIFFNYEAFGLEKPPYFTKCEIIWLDYKKTQDPDDRASLFNFVKYYDYQVLSGSSTGIYRIIKPECSLCTYFSSNIKPDFWED